MALTRPKAAQIDFDVTNITDPLFRLNSGQALANDKDIGIVVERGSDTNTAIIWDESADEFAVINTTEDGTTSGDVTISSYANIRANAFYGDGSNLTGTGATDPLTLTNTDTGSAAGPSINLYRNSASPAAADYLGEIDFQGESSTGITRSYAQIKGKIADPTNGSEDGTLEFWIRNNGSNNVTARMNENGILLTDGMTLKYEGATNDSNETTLTVADPTADRTITLPDATGTVVLQDSTDTLQNKTLRAPTFEAGSNAPSFIEQRFVNANTMRTALMFNGSSSGSYFTQNEYQKFVTITPGGDAKNYTFFARITATSASSYHTVYFTGALRSNTLPDLSWTVTYNEEHNGTRFVEPKLWTKETSTAGFILAFKYINGSNLYGNVTVDIDIIPRNSTDRGDVVFNTTQASEQTSIDTGFSEQDPTKIFTLASGVMEYSTQFRFEGATEDGFETTVTATDPTADRTITFPNATGTVALTDSFTHFHSAPQTVTSSQETTNASSTVDYTFSELNNAVHYVAFLNRTVMRASEYSVSGTTLTVNSGVLATDDQIEVTGFST